VDFQNLAELLLAGGLAGLIGAMVMAWKTRRDAVRDDRRQRVDESTGTATAAKTLTEAAASLVKMQDDQVDEFKLQIRAVQAESSALNTRLDKEIEKRLRSEAKVSMLESEIASQRNQLAMMGAQFELADQDRQLLRRENGAMKTKIFEMSVGIAALTRQAREAGLEPVYILEVPPTETQPLHSLGDLKE
jgi:chromosome segregation ATPase